MSKAVATIRTLTLLLVGAITSQAYATDITFTMSGPSPYCAGSNATLTYDATGNTFTGTNVFTAQLSDATGSFAGPVTVGTLASTSITGVISITFPGAASGTAYRIRIVASSPSVTGTDNGSDLTINAVTNVTPTISITSNPSTTVGAGSPVYFSSTITNGGASPIYTWKKNGTPVGNSNAYVLDTPADGDQIVAVVNSSLGCSSPDFATSNTITVSVDNNLTETNHSWGQRIGQPDGMGGYIERVNGSGFSIGAPTNKVYIACGSSPSAAYRKDLWEYDPLTDAWTQKADFIGTARYNAVGFSVGTKGYIGLGTTGPGTFVNDFYQYDPNTNSWLARLSFPGAARELAFGFGINGSVNRGYIGGGTSSGTDYKDFFEYNPTNNSWTARTNFGGGKRMGSAAFSSDTKAYVVAGNSSTTGAWYSDLWEYEPIGFTWTQKQNMPGGPRTRATAFTLAGDGYVGLGSSSAGSKGDFYRYNIGTNTWTQKPFFPGPPTESGGVGLVVNNRAFIYKDGRMFEYTLLTITPFPSKICTTETIPINFDASGFVFNASNLFTAQISTSPTFSVSTTLGTLMFKDPVGTVNAVFPTSANGSYYFRVTTTNPVMTTMVETITVTSLPATHSISSESGNAVCVGIPVTFTSTLDGPGFQWYKNNQPVGTDDQSYTDPELVNDDAIKAVRTYTAGCTQPVGVSSNTIQMTIRTPATPIVTVNQPNILTSTAATAYQWYKDGNTINKGTNQSYTMTESGVYKVRIQDSFGCYAFSEDLHDAFTGLEDNSFALEISAYPSPFSNDVFLSLADDIVAQGAHFSLLNELGQTIVNKQQAQKVNKLEMTGKAPGLYILRVSFGHNMVIRKLVKVN